MTVMMSSDLTSFARERPTIVIIDRQTLSRTALARVLRSELVGYEIIDLACTHAIAELSDRPVALILFNIHGHEMSERCVLEHIGQLRRTLPREALMLLTQQSEATISDATLSEVARAGVRGYVTDRDAIDIAIAAMKLVIAGGVYFPRPVSGGLDEAAAAATAALRDAALAAVPTRLLDARDVVAVVAEVGVSGAAHPGRLHPARAGSDRHAAARALQQDHRQRAQPFAEHRQGSHLAHHAQAQGHQSHRGGARRPAQLPFRRGLIPAGPSSRKARSGRRHPTGSWLFRRLPAACRPLRCLHRPHWRLSATGYRWDTY